MGQPADCRLTGKTDAEQQNGREVTVGRSSFYIVSHIHKLQTTKNHAPFCSNGHPGRSEGRLERYGVALYVEEYLCGEEPMRKRSVCSARCGDSGNGEIFIERFHFLHGNTRSIPPLIHKYNPQDTGIVAIMQLNIDVEQL